MVSFHVDPWIALVGLVVGTLVGLSGVGGGSLVTPLLVLIVGVQSTVAVGTDLLYSVPTKMLGAAVHHRQGTVNWRLVGYLTLGGVPSAIAGLVLLGFLQQHLGMIAVNMTLKHGLGAMLILVAAAIVLKPFLSRRAPSAASDGVIQWTHGAKVHIVTLGALVGFLVSLTSIGSGSLTVPVLYFLVPRLGLRQLVGSDVAFAAILIPIAAAGHLQMGHVNLGLAISLLIGSLPGVLIGSYLCRWLPDVWLRPVLSVALLFAGSKLI